MKPVTPADGLPALVAEACALTDATPPAVLDDDSPVLTDQVAPAEIYFVGLIGGKEVGKSSFVNALVGQEVTRATSHGPGTSRVVAYCHRAAAESAVELLDREVPDAYDLVTHDEPSLAHQVLLDLPDIDSLHAAHLKLTRRMLRHMLFPIWMQSVEKYADQQPRKLLQAVAEGNDPANFLFVLNKADQLVAREGEAAAEELREDYARRIGEALGLAEPPRVSLAAATAPDRFDLPALRAMLSKQRGVQDVAAARRLAARRRARSVLTWFDGLNLPARRQAVEHVLDDAAELLQTRVANVVLQETIPRLLDDPAHQQAVAEPAVRARLARWPIVNALDLVLAPLVVLARRSFVGGEGVSLSHAGRPLAGRLQGAFAQLRQQSPAVATLYAGNELWTDYPAEVAAGDLRDRLEAATRRQKQLAEERFAGRGVPVLGPLCRWLLTVGVLVWFPIVQPVAAILLSPVSTDAGLIDTAYRVVTLLGAGPILQSLALVSIWFVALWLLLRAGATRKVRRLLAGDGRADPDTLAGEVYTWLDALLSPLKQRLDRLARLEDQVTTLRTTIEDKRAA
ncbi:MAG: GTPase [Phycisphaerae bacterium]